jgi:maleylacetate reductase
VSGEAPRVRFGAGLATSALSDEVDRLGARRVLVIATPREYARSTALLAPLTDRVAGVFTAVLPHVPVEVAAAARDAAAHAEADLLLAIGGGSTVGTAKAIALTAGVPILAVPTTYAGSEVTPVWGLTDENGKTTGTDPRVRPVTVLYDPLLTRSLPLDESRLSGVNALAHCVDAFWAPATSPEIRNEAEVAIRELADGLRTLDDDGTGREPLLRGAMLAGLVFARSGSGLHHKICHVLGGRYALPHAPTHAVMLPHSYAFNAVAVPDAARRIEAALGGVGPGAFERRLGVPLRLSDLGFDPGQIGPAAAAIAPAVPASNPRPVSVDDLVGILTAAYYGEEEATP